jgi:CRISPR/Cas system-associated protein Csm6
MYIHRSLEDKLRKTALKEIIKLRENKREENVGKTSKPNACKIVERKHYKTTKKKNLRNKRIKIQRAKRRRRNGGKIQFCYRHPSQEKATQSEILAPIL